jgi:hypothetical protein
MPASGDADESDELLTRERLHPSVEETLATDVAVVVLGVDPAIAAPVQKTITPGWSVMSRPIGGVPFAVEKQRSDLRRMRCPQRLSPQSVRSRFVLARVEACSSARSRMVVFGREANDRTSRNATSVMC